MRRVGIAEKTNDGFVECGANVHGPSIAADHRIAYRQSRNQVVERTRGKGCHRKALCGIQDLRRLLIVSRVHCAFSWRPEQGKSQRFILE
jgi:hypothetical protein